MIVYGTREEEADPRERLTALRRLLLEARAGSPPGQHDQIVELLIAFGELEAALVDALCPEADADPPLAQRLRHAAVLIAHAFYHSWAGQTAQARAWLGRADGALSRVSSSELPARVLFRVAEGYAYYGLYPECYLDAAARFFREVQPTATVCIGIRSIGTSLCAVVAAVLEELGCDVWSCTVRPRGHPFHRRLALSARFAEELRACSSRYALVVDEGPGLSGSSLAAVAEKAAELGFPDDRIILFPSWEPPGDVLLSESARARWSRHRKYTTSFEAVWIESGRLARSLPRGELLDLSAGRWRALVYHGDADYPAVQPQHERRKYLLRAAPDAPTGSAPLLMKFAGLGRYGRAALARGERLAAAGFGPPVLGLAQGFLLSSFVPGRPLAASGVDAELLDAVARYIAFVARAFPAARPVPFDEIMEMIRVNTEEGLGPGWTEALRALERMRPEVCARPTVAIDGRMLPHEWLRTPQGYLKTDGIEHHADHFFPGCQDIAWDLAGAILEFDLDAAARAALLARYQTLTNDGTVARVLPFYCVAYAAYRLGYATLASQALGQGAEAARWQALAARYASRLRQLLASAPDA